MRAGGNKMMDGLAVEECGTVSLARRRGLEEESQQYEDPDELSPVREQIGIQYSDDGRGQGPMELLEAQDGPVPAQTQMAGGARVCRGGERYDLRG